MFLSLLRIHWELDHIWCLNCKKVQKVERRVRTTPGSEQMQSDLQQVDRIGSHLMHWMHSKGEKTICRRGTTKCGEKHTNLTFPRMNARSNPIFLWSTRDPIKSISDGVQRTREPIRCFLGGVQRKRESSLEQTAWYRWRTSKCRCTSGSEADPFVVHPLQYTSSIFVSI